MESKEYLEGYRAGYLGYHDTCTYDEGTDKRVKWQHGFDAGQKDWCTGKRPAHDV